MSRPAKCPTCKRPMDDDKHRGFFFKAIAAAFENWPENAEFQPATTEHLRAWLLIEAGRYSTVDVLGTEAVTIANMKVAAALLGKPHAFRMGRIADGVRVYAPVSMAKDAVSKKEFDAIALDVYNIIEAVVGVGVERLVREGGLGHADNGVQNTRISGESVGEGCCEQSRELSRGGSCRQMATQTP